MKTRLTTRFDLRYPIVSAPMAGAAGGALATAVTHAGGFGFIGGGYSDPDWIAAEFANAGNAAVGCGFITWKLAEGPGGGVPLVASVLKRKPRALFFSFGDFAPFMPLAKDAGVPVMAQVQTVAQARQAADMGADVIVAQGGEAGGHGATRGTMSLVPEVVDAVGARAIILAAGGIADGRGLAAALMLGADGVLIGSRLWASAEALVPQGFHAAAVTASGDDTARTSLPDIARGLDWPAPYTIRTLRSDWVKRFEEVEGGPATPDARSAYAAAMAAGDAANAAAIVGEAVGLIRDIRPAGQIVEEIGQTAQGLLTAAAKGNE